MAGAAAVLALLTLALLAASARVRADGDDFSLADALDDDVPKKPTPKAPTPKKPSGGFDLEDALGGGAADPEEKPSRPGNRPRPHPHGDSGGISDSDLEGVGGRGDGPGSHAGDSPQPEGTPEGLIPGVVAAVVASLAGAVSSFIAYQKRRLCFREGGSAPV